VGPKASVDMVTVYSLVTILSELPHENGKIYTVQNFGIYSHFLVTLIYINGVYDGLDMYFRWNKKCILNLYGAS
jgi:hypothetical protein